MDLEIPDDLLFRSEESFQVACRNRIQTEGRSIVRLPKGIKSVKGLIFLSYILFPRAQQNFRRDSSTLQKFLQFLQTENEMVVSSLC